jgi:hypothetical protein
MCSFMRRTWCWTMKSLTDKTSHPCWGPSRGSVRWGALTFHKGDKPIAVFINPWVEVHAFVRDGFTWGPSTNIAQGANFIVRKGGACAPDFAHSS